MRRPRGGGARVSARGGAQPQLASHRGAIGGGPERPRVERRGDPRVGLRDAFARVIANTPHDPTAWNNMGVLYARLGRHREATPYFERALAIDPRHVLARRNIADSRAAIASAEEGETRAAEP